MANNKKNNPLNFTGLDYEAIRDQIEYELSQSPAFENFRDSSLTKTFLDLFAATTDLNNYYIERRAEEQFLETARLKSSAIQLTKQLGYSPRRPVPANTALSIIISGPLPPGLLENDTVQFTKLTPFTGAGLNFVLKKSYTYTFTAEDQSQIGNPDYIKQIDFGVELSASNDDIPLDEIGGVDSRFLVDIEMLQGELKVERINGSTDNPQVGQLFQKYRISDTMFCNLYGEDDLGFDKESGDETITQNITKVGIGSTQTNALLEENLYTIDRRSLINPSKLDSSSSSIPRLVLVTSNLDEGILLSFGDDKFAGKGLRNSSESIYVQYLATEGADANQTGLLGEEIKSTASFVTQNSINVTDNLSFTFKRNVTAGENFEELESMKLNAPALFYSLDRLITIRDYVSYLKTLSIGEDGGIIKNALAWGEQEEIRNRNQLANFRFFNIVFFSVLGKLYNFPTNGTFTNITEDDISKSYLELEEDFSVVDATTGVVSADGFPEQAYFNVLVKEVPQPEVQRVKDFRTLNDTHPITTTLNKLDERAQTTVRTIYITPFVQKIKLKGDISIGKLEDRVVIKKTINNRIYEWLNENADFNVKIYKSDIYDLIHDTPEVKFANIGFEATKPEQLITSWVTDEDVSTKAFDQPTSAAIVSVIESEITTWLDAGGFAQIEDRGDSFARTTAMDTGLIVNEVLETSAGTLSGGSAGIAINNFDSNKYVYQDKVHYIAGNISEKTFYQNLMKGIYDGLGTSLLDVDGGIWRDSQYFKNVMFKLHNDFLPAIRTGMIDKEGDITNYSLNNEIVQIEIVLNYVFV